MALALPRYTPYRDVNIVLHRLRRDVEGILGNQLVGIYLYGSLASGDFDPSTSDVDFIVVTEGELSAAQVAALDAMHREIGASNLPFAKELEGSYIPKRALRRHDPDDMHHPHINSHDEKGITLTIQPHGGDWVLQRYTVREFSPAIVGPAPQTLIDPVSPEAIREGVRSILAGWWTEMLTSPLLAEAGYQVFAALTMCRALYACEQGALLSKPEAARRALGALDARWHWLIEWALTYPAPAPRDPTEEIRAFIRYTLAQCGVG